MNKLQELTDKLYNEGLSKGKQEGEAILEKAKTEAESIVETARKEAEQILLPVFVWNVVHHFVI